MKNIINKCLIGCCLMAGATLFNSCGEDYLNTAPTESVGDQIAMSDVSKAYKTLNGVAKTMTIQHNAYGGGFCGENAIMRLYESLPSQNYNFNRYASGWAPVHNQQMHTSRTAIYNHYAWYYYYQIITQANVIISRIDQAAGGDADKKFIKASALTFRAYGYEKLMHYFCPRWQDSQEGAARAVPLRLDESTGDVAPSTMKEVYGQIYQDLDMAITLFGESGIDREDGNVWIPNLNVAHAIYARAALTRQDYQVALDHATLAQDKYPLMKNDAYGAGFCQPTSEWIFGSYGDSNENNWYWSFGVQGACNGYYAQTQDTGAGTIGRELINRIPDADFRKSIFLTESGLGINANDTAQVDQTFGQIGKNDSLLRVQVRKYITAHAAKGLEAPYKNNYFELGAQLKFYVIDQPGVGYIPFIRSSEMVLIEAEANYFLGKTEAAQAALVKLNASSERNKGYTCNKTGQELFDEIKDYREVELWGEGHAWSDYKRWNLPVVRHSFAQGGNAHESVAITIQPNEANNWVWETPIYETDFNGGYNINGPTAP